MTAALQFDRVSKAYRLGESTRSLREAISAAGRSLIGRRRKEALPLLWALNGVSFDIHKGEAVGIVGRNGAGKTTILKLLSRITRCTSGVINVSGRVSALIELGAGFHPDLTGRENVFLNSAILGMSRREAHDRMEQIVDFSGLNGFMDTPVKRYSSGMYARLGFSIAAHTNADILLVDEVLAVGDANFQAKSIQKMRSLVDSGTTVVFVSHSLYYVNHFCDRAILLDCGKILGIGPPPGIISAYQHTLQNSAIKRIREDNAKEGCSVGGAVARISRVELLDESGNPSDKFTIGRSLVLKVGLQSSGPFSKPVVEFEISSAAGQLCYKSHNHVDSFDIPDLNGTAAIAITLSDMRLLPGCYTVSVRLLERNAIAAVDAMECVCSFTVDSGGIPVAVENGVVFMPHTWKLLE
jgi:ABC-type polysaccharide/polyol phosphate transport system ATPase subunit